MRNDFVIDFNIVFSAVLNKGHSLEIFINNFLKEKFSFIAPQYLLIELNKHTNRITQKTSFSFDEVLDIISFVTDQITFIPDQEFIDRLSDAKNILKDHEKDVPYLALALVKNCDILSGDKTLKKLCPNKVKTPKEVLEMFYEDKSVIK